jgi:sugar lactone lactonase YvrE
MPTIAPLADRIGLPEAPRWRDGVLYLSDMLHNRVLAVDGVSGEKSVVVELSQRPGGIGWGPDGTMYVVGMDSRQLFALEGGMARAVTDLSPYGSVCNDMVINARGHAYIGVFEIGTGTTSAERIRTARPSPLVLVDLAAPAWPTVVAEGLILPNGMVLGPGEDTLIVAETQLRRLTVFRVRADGSLYDQRVWAKLEGNPDGICLDEENCVWAAVPTRPGGFIRVREGGDVAEFLDTGTAGFACTLGGSDGRTLFLLEAGEWPPLPAGSSTGQVRTIRVAACHAGTL